MTRTLSAAQAERYRPWFDNARRLRELVNELQALSVHAINEAEGWDGDFVPTLRTQDGYGP